MPDNAFICSKELQCMVRLASRNTTPSTLTLSSSLADAISFDAYIDISSWRRRQWARIEQIVSTACGSLRARDNIREGLRDAGRWTEAKIVAKGFGCAGVGCAFDGFDVEGADKATVRV